MFTSIRIDVLCYPGLSSVIDSRGYSGDVSLLYVRALQASSAALSAWTTFVCTSVITMLTRQSMAWGNQRVASVPRYPYSLIWFGSCCQLWSALGKRIDLPFLQTQWGSFYIQCHPKEQTQVLALKTSQTCALFTCLPTYHHSLNCRAFIMQVCMGMQLGPV